MGESAALNAAAAGAVVAAAAAAAAEASEDESAPRRLCSPVLGGLGLASVIRPRRAWDCM